MRTDKLAVLATVLAVFYLVLKGTGAPAKHTVMHLPVAVYHPPRRPPVKVYHPPRRIWHPPIKVIYPPAKHPPITRFPIHFPPILGHYFHPPTRRIGKYQPV